VVLALPLGVCVFVRLDGCLGPGVGCSCSVCVASVSSGGSLGGVYLGLGRGGCADFGVLGCLCAKLFVVGLAIGSDVGVVFGLSDRVILFLCAVVYLVAILWLGSVLLLVS